VLSGAAATVSSYIYTARHKALFVMCKSFLIRRFLFILLTFAASYGYGQNTYFDKYEHDTLHLPAVQIKRIVALRSGDAVIGIDYKIFTKYLQAERK
jgi:hypothetical protein